MEIPLIDGYPAYLAEYQHGDRYVYVVPMIFNTRITIGPKYEEGFWDDAWCFATALEALAEAARWDPDKEEEPRGWVKHPMSGRYRPDGDPAREYNQRDPPPDE